MGVQKVVEAKLHSYDFLALRKLKSMALKSKSSIVIRACFIDLLAAHIVQFATTVSKDLTITALGLDNASGG